MRKLRNICQSEISSVLNHSTVDVRDFSTRAPDSYNISESMYFRTLIPNHPHDIGLKCSPGMILAKNCLDHVI